MAQTYSIEFKEEACRRVQSVISATQVARELGVIRPKDAVTFCLSNYIRG